MCIITYNYKSLDQYFLYSFMYFHTLFYSSALSCFDTNLFCVLIHILSVFVCLRQTYSHIEFWQTLFFNFFLAQVIFCIDLNSVFVTFLFLTSWYCSDLSLFFVCFFPNYILYLFIVSDVLLVMIMKKINFRFFLIIIVAQFFHPNQAFWSYLQFHI